MKNFIKNIFIIAVLLLIYIKRPLVINAIVDSSILWQKSVFPSIFPIMIISDYILSTNLINIISDSFGLFFSKLFKVSKYSVYIFIMSIISGCPTNAKYIKDLLNKNIISNREASKILAISLFYNPFLIITITSFLNLRDSIFLIIINILTNIIIGIINRSYECDLLNNSFICKNFNLIESISNAINVLLLILGSIITFVILSTLLPIKHPLISGILEITNGIYLIDSADILYRYKFIFTGILMSFGGLSIIYQIKSIFKDTLIDYSLYYKSRIYHVIIMLLFIYFYQYYLYNLLPA